MSSSSGRRNALVEELFAVARGVGSSPNITARLVELVREVGDVNTKLKGWCAVHSATRSSEPASAAQLQTLVHALGADVNARIDDCGSTCLHLLAEKPHEAKAQILLAAPSIDVNQRDKAGVTPLERAVIFHNVAFVELLVGAGAAYDLARCMQLDAQHEGCCAALFVKLKSGHAISSPKKATTPQRPVSKASFGAAAPTSESEVLSIASSSSSPLQQRSPPQQQQQAPSAAVSGLSSVLMSGLSAASAGPGPVPLVRHLRSVSLADDFPLDCYDSVENFERYVPPSHVVAEADLTMEVSIGIVAAGGAGSLLAATLRTATRTEPVLVKVNRGDGGADAQRRWLREVHVSLTLSAKARAERGGCRYIGRAFAVCFTDRGNVGRRVALLVLERGSYDLEQLLVARQLRRAGQQMEQPTATHAVEDDVALFSRCARHVAHALAWLHHPQQGVIVHHDLKSKNIIGFPCGAETEWRVLDFGSSVATRRRRRNQLQLLEQGEAEQGAGEEPFSQLGRTLTVNYAAPERFASRDGGSSISLSNAPSRPSMDCYSFGCLLFRMIADKPPPPQQQAAGFVDDAAEEGRRWLAETGGDEQSHQERQRTKEQLVAAMVACLHPNPLQRPQSGVDILRMLLREGEALPPELEPASPSSAAAAAAGLSVHQRDEDEEDDEQRASQAMEQALALVLRGSQLVAAAANASGTDSTVSFKGATQTG